MSQLIHYGECIPSVKIMSVISEWWPSVFICCTNYKYYWAVNCIIHTVCQYCNFVGITMSLFLQTVYTLAYINRRDFVAILLRRFSEQIALSRELCDT